MPLACAALPKVFSTFVQLWLSEKAEVTTGVTHALERLLRDAVTPACETPKSVEQYKSKLAKCFNSIELGLGYQYNTVWQQVLHVIGVMFEVSIISMQLTLNMNKCVVLLGWWKELQ